MSSTHLMTKSNTWPSNSGKDPNNKQRSAETTPLATQLQQAWLQTQLPKRNVPRVDYLSPLPSPDYVVRSSSSSFSQPSPRSISPDSYSASLSEVGSFSPGLDSDAGTESDLMEDDYALKYLSDMLMEEDMEEKKCMYLECSTYQAMNKELAELIGHTGPTDDFYCGTDVEKDRAVNSWIDEVLNSSPADYLSDELGVLTTKDWTVRGSDSLPPHSRPLPKSSVYSELYCAFPDGREGLEFGKDYSNGRSGIESLEELHPLLMQCAQAVAADDVRRANSLINELRAKSSQNGDGGQRLSYYFVEALVARLSGTGAQLYTAISASRPSATAMLKAFRMLVQHNPLPKICHLLGNVAIYKAVKGAEKVHIIDYGILYGMQWPCLLRRLAQRPEGAPHVRITGIDFPQPGFHKSEGVEETGRRLAETAKEFGIEFEFQAIAGKWENIQPAQLNIRQDEVLIVNSMLRLRNLLDETVMASSPRKMVLQKIHSLNPTLFVMGVFSGGYNSPFFMARFRESLNYYSAAFDALHTTVPPDCDLRPLVEKEIFGRLILNIVACEGTERIERSETYKQWQSRTINAGFKQEPLDEEVFRLAQNKLKPFHRSYGIARDGNWILSGWKDRVIHGVTTWRSA